jgi:signal transduction histidine kinase
MAYRAPMQPSDAPRRPPAAWPRLLSGWPLDLAIAVVAGVVQLVGTSFAAQHQPARRPLDALGYALLAAGPAATLGRRRHPVAVLAVVFVLTRLYLALDYPEGPIYLALIVAFFTTMLAGHRLVGWLVLAAGYVTFLWLDPLLGRGPAPSLLEGTALAAWLLVLGGSAEIVRVRRAYLRATELRAEQAERTREEEARRRASEERLRIARELHDVLAHNISLINVQSGVALHLIDERPEQARTALVAIKQASKDALREVRATLGALRGVDEELPRSPTPSLARLDELTARMAGAGLEVRTRVAGEPRQLPAGVDVAAFRIVQEALTNVARHAGPATATVQVTYGERDLTVQVDDDGRGVPAAARAGTGTGSSGGGGTSAGTSSGGGTSTSGDAAASGTSAGGGGTGTRAGGGGPGTGTGTGGGAGGGGGGGNGILGMRERATALGGELQAGPRPDRGFRVLARLPLDGTA